MAYHRSISVASVREPRPRVRRHLAMGVVVGAYLAAAAVVVAVPGAFEQRRWLAVHLLGLGAATNAVLVWSRHFAQALLHARLGSERPAVARLALLNTGVVAVLAGVAAGVPVLAGAAAGLVVLVVLAHGVSLVAMARGHRLPGRLRPVVWFYVASAACLAVGAAFGAVMGGEAVADDGVAQQRLHLAHAELNLLGWIGLAVLGTVVVLWPAVLRTRMVDRAPAAAPWTFAGCVAGLAVLTTGVLAGGRAVSVAGLVVYGVGVVLAADPLVRTMRQRPPSSAAAWFLAGALGWLVAGLVVDAVQLGRTADPDVVLARVVPMLAVGLVAQALVGALTFLLPVTVGGGPDGNRRMAAVLDAGWPVRIGVGNAGLLLAVVPGPHALRVIGWVAVVAGLAAFVPLLAAALWRRRPGGSASPG